MQRNKEIHTAYLALGSNLGDKELNMNVALTKIQKRIGKITACSAFYVTDPVGFLSDNQFINSVCCIKTIYSPLEVLALTQSIEINMGRVHKSDNKVYADRIIDIDLLLYDNLILNIDELILPHPHLHKRDFVLRPLIEIAGELIHPILGESMIELNKKNEDNKTKL